MRLDRRRFWVTLGLQPLQLRSDLIDLHQEMPFVAVPSGVQRLQFDARCFS